MSKEEVMSRLKGDRFCRTCKWVCNQSKHPGAMFGFKRAIKVKSEFWKCGYPLAARVDLIAGTSTIYYCSTHRESNATNEFCGRDGQFWEPK